jgi:ATP-dependent helicase/DNAse subunit B
MAKDKYTAVWVSHSSISDFLKCPRAYFLRNVYKDPKTGHKITQMKPQLALGQVVHDVIDEISTLPVDERLSISLVKRLDAHWEKVTGKLGGFMSKEEEEEYKKRGVKMLEMLEEFPGPLVNKAVKIPQELPHYWISEEDNIILCGKIDWLEYIETNDSVHILDFKTGKIEEGQDSLQLPIYYLLVINTQNRKVGKASYWYLAKDKIPVEVSLPDADEAYTQVMEVAKRIKLGRQINHFKCPKDGCYACTPLERLVNGEGELVGVSGYNQDVYILQ